MEAQRVKRALGGICYSGDIVKAIAAGAETVMLGSLFAGLEEAPGKLVPEGVEEMVRITAAAYAESHPQSIMITKEAPNYQKRD